MVQNQTITMHVILSLELSGKFSVFFFFLHLNRLLHRSSFIRLSSSHDHIL